MKKTLLASPLFTRINSFCNKHSLLAQTDTVIVGFSGGPDSLFLLHVLAALLPPEKIIAAHLNHGWRPESKDEAAWCKTAATQLGLRFFSAHFDDYALLVKNRGSKEDQARQARRLFFTAIAKQHNAQSIALAHHVDDQRETFFIRLIRGAGLQGLTGMHPRQNRYIRPLLELSKDEIISFLDTHAPLIDNKRYLVDPSNGTTDYLRNRIRHTLMPALTTCDQRAATTVLTAITHLQEVDQYLDEQAHKAYKSLRNPLISQKSSLDLVKDSKKADTFSKALTISENGILPTHRIMQDNKATRDVPDQRSKSFEQPLICLDNLQKLHPLIRHRVLVFWLCEAQTPFTPSKTFFAEIERFLFQSHTSSSHAIAPEWALRKNKNNTAHLEKITR